MEGKQADISHGEDGNVLVQGSCIGLGFQEMDSLPRRGDRKSETSRIDWNTE